MSTTPTDQWVVVVTATVMDGQVVRWYRNETHAEYGRETISASRNGVVVTGFLHNVPDLLLTVADDIRRGLAAGADVRHAATHERSLRGELRRIERG